ncbi:class I SAM-dependent methyltransferase [Ornithinimicrobium faecis]|uniref:class I SAM-dependent methyltransferase n=1 Tax=Ornithinimicrobium faecis TaxID=2934158 RepID=UPI002117F322|nr:class I SAM-dependent methyltransferase [Ornithinimicrobium sp. HY1745]
MPTHTMSAEGATGRAPTSSYRPGTGRPRADEMDRLDRQAQLTFDVEFGLLREGGLRTDGTLLDLGSGNGAITTRLRERLPEATVIGVDVDPELLALVPAPSLLIEDGRIPVEDESVDDVLVRFVAQHLTPAARLDLWTEVLRVLAPGGRVHIVDVDDTASGVTTPLQPGLAPIFAKLHHAQAADGGDRMVIGKVAPELEAVGFVHAQQVRDAVSSSERPIEDFAVHVGPERHVPHVSTGVLSLADLAAITRGWQAILADPAGSVCVYVHLVRASKPGPVSMGSAPTTEGEAP